MNHGTLYSRFLVLAVFICALGVKAFSQTTYPEVSLLFSRSMPGGSARIQSLGGAQTALGGDYSAAYANPAGLGMFNRSQVSISGGLWMPKNTATYIGQEKTMGEYKLNIPGFSLVFTKPILPGEGSGWVNGSWGVTFNRTNDFNKLIDYGATNSQNTMIDFFTESAKGQSPAQFGTSGRYYNSLAGLAYRTYLIQPASGGGAYVYDSPLSGIGTNKAQDYRSQLQQEDITMRGHQSQISIAYGANYSDKIFVGFNVGVVSSSFGYTRTFSESNYVFKNNPSPLDRYELAEFSSSSGIGINFRAGVIARPWLHWQFGLSYASPTYNAMVEQYDAYIIAKWNDVPLGTITLRDEYSSTDRLLSEYSLSLPSHTNIGAAYFFGKRGFISADAELVNYGGSRYKDSASGSQFSEDNKNIKEGYKRVINLRVGAEYRIKSFALRGGYGWLPSPTYSNFRGGADRTQKQITCGTGWRHRGGRNSLDFAFSAVLGNDSHLPYNAPMPVLDVRYRNANFMFTYSFGL